jgi:hypothetical protein
MSARSKLDRPATVTWSVMGPSGKPMPPNGRDFETFREAILYVRRLPQGTRAKAKLYSGGKSYGPDEIEELEREMRRA